MLVDWIHMEIHYGDGLCVTLPVTVMFELAPRDKVECEINWLNKSSVIRQKGESQRVFQENKAHQIFRKNEHF